MKISTFIVTAVLAFAAAGLCQSGITTSGQVQLTAPPNSVLPGAYENDAAADLFLENLDVVLSGNVTVDASQPGTYISSSDLTPGVLRAGTAVADYYLHADPVVSTGTAFSGLILFGNDILGVIESAATLAASDSVLGVSEVAWPGALPARGFELSATQDNFTISADRRTLTFNALTWGAVDDMRIVTAANSQQSGSQPPAPEPASVALAVIGLGAGLGAELWFRRRFTASP